jgi:hypothetical protein
MGFNSRNTLNHTLHSRLILRGLIYICMASAKFLLLFYFQDGLQPTITTGWKKRGPFDFQQVLMHGRQKRQHHLYNSNKKKRAFYPNMVMKEITHTTPLQRHTHYRHTNNTQTLAHTKRSSSGNSCRISFFLNNTFRERNNA